MHGKLTKSFSWSAKSRLSKFDCRWTKAVVVEMINHMSRVYIWLGGESRTCLPRGFLLGRSAPYQCTLKTTQNVKKANFVLAEDTPF